MAAQDFPLVQVRISILHTSTFTDVDGAATVDVTTGNYKASLNRLKAGDIAQESMPWPATRNRFWEYQLGRDYKSTSTRDLVAALVPLWHADDVHATVSGPDELRKAFRFEYYRHPFAVCTALHGTFGDRAERPQIDDFAVILDAALRSGLDDTNEQLRDGAPLAWIPELPTADAMGNPATFRPAQPIVILSGLQDRDGDPLELASRMAARFTGAGKKTAVALKSEGAALAIDNRTIAIVLPHAVSERSSIHRCLHNNLSIATAIIENLLSVQRAAATVPAEWFRSEAATVLTAMYNGAPLPNVGTCYKSVLTREWIKRSGLVDQLNARAAESQYPPAAPISV